MLLQHIINLILVQSEQSERQSLLLKSFGQNNDQVVCFSIVTILSGLDASKSEAPTIQLDIQYFVVT